MVVAAVAPAAVVNAALLDNRVDCGCEKDDRPVAEMDPHRVLGVLLREDGDARGDAPEPWVRLLCWQWSR